MVSKRIDLAASQYFRATGETIGLKAEKVASMDGENVRLG